MRDDFEFPGSRYIADMGIGVAIASRGRQLIASAIGALCGEDKQSVPRNTSPHALEQRAQIADIGQHIAARLNKILFTNYIIDVYNSILMLFIRIVRYPAFI